MLDIERLLVEGNLKYYLKINQESENLETSGKFPRYPVLILTCMDSRIDIHRIFQLEPGDVFVLRNAGNLSTQDSLRSILIAIYQYDIKFIVVLGHLNCGMTKVNLLELKKKIPYEYFPHAAKGTSDLFGEIKEFFKPFIDEIKNIKRQIGILQKLRVHNPELKILGMLYDVGSGWVLEYDLIKKISSMKDLKMQYKSLLKEKQFQFIDFLESVEEEIVNDKDMKEVTQEQDFDEQEEELSKVVLNEDNMIQSNAFNQEFRAPFVFPKIRVPKITFQRVKIYTPKISRKKSE
ncbi:MAG: carbonic anhydrase [Candidatus Thorarchaeota archaeon]